METPATSPMAQPKTPQSAYSTTSTADSWLDSGSKVGPCGRNVNREAALLLVLDELLGRDVDAHELRAASQHPEFRTSLTVRELSVLVDRLHLDQPQQTGSQGHTEEDEEDGTACASQLSYRSVDCCTTARSWEPASPCSSQAPAGRATPSIPALSMLGMLGQGSVQGSEGDTYRSIPHSSDMHMGQPTVRTRRKLNSLVDPDWLRVMLPAASRRAQMPAHNTPMQREPVSRLDAQPSPTLQPPGQPGHEDEPSTRSLAARISDDSIDQQQPQQVPTQSTSPFKKEVKSDVVSDVSKKASTRALPPLQMSDVALERDVGPPVSSRPPASARPRRKSFMMRSIASHQLGANWWAEYAIDEEDEEVVLPEELWTIHGALQAGAPDTLSSRLIFHQQLARTEFSTVWAADLLDPDTWHPQLVLPGVCEEEVEGTDDESTAMRSMNAAHCTPVVVKILEMDDRPLLANAFAEASVLDSLRDWHGSVQLLECGRTEEGHVLLVLQRCDEDLRAWRQRQDDAHVQIDVVDLLRMFQTIVSLVAELHSRGIAHCDLKLDNVLVCGDDLLLSDFSEAVTFSSPEEAQLTESRGTSQYESPEMCSSTATDARAADVWALGCLMWELLTGARSCLFAGACSCLRPCTLGRDHWMTAEEDKALLQACGVGHSSDKAAQLAADVKELLLDILVKAEQRPSSQELAARVGTLCEVLSEM